MRQLGYRAVMSNGLLSARRRSWRSQFRHGPPRRKRSTLPSGLVEPACGYSARKRIGRLSGRISQRARPRGIDPGVSGGGYVCVQPGTYLYGLSGNPRSYPAEQWYRRALALGQRRPHGPGNRPLSTWGRPHTRDFPMQKTPAAARGAY